MPPHAVEPGTRLVDRYRLEKHLGAAGGTAYWRAHDELLDRPVGVCLLAGDDGHADRVLRAARRAAAVTDPRYLRVLDASEVDGPQGRVVYVVNEWVRATSLADLLRDGPLSPPEARELTVEIADALEAAHGQGLSHLCLEPEHVLRTAHGQVKIVGLAVEAAVRGIEAADEADAARRDTEGAAAVAYAALTGRWPGEGSTGLPAAPHDGNGLCTPRQVRAGVPHDLDHVVGRALGAGSGHEPPLRRPAELAAALGDAHVTTRIPTAISLTEPPSSDSYPPGRVAPYDDQRRRTSRTAVLAWGAVVLVLAVGLALAGSQLVLTVMGGGGDDKGSTPSGTASPASTSTPTGKPIEVAAVTSFDPEGADGEENEDRVDLAVDGQPSTAWTTKTYFDQFGDTGLKHGVGLVLDLGASTEVSSVVVRTNGGAGLELRASDSKGSDVEDYEEVAAASDVDGRAVLVPRQQLKARYLLVWLTKLPAVGSDYRGDISEIVVRG